MWGLYLIGLVAYIPQSPVQAYLSLTLKRIGFSTFDSNMLSIPSAALQITLMLALSTSSEYFGERTFHCLVGEFWSLPLLAALLALPSGGRDWGRFTITTLISGYPYFHPIVSAWISENTFDVKKRAITAATYNVIVQVGSVVSSREFLYFRSVEGKLKGWLADVDQRFIGMRISHTIILGIRCLLRSVRCLWWYSLFRGSISGI